MGMMPQQERARGSRAPWGWRVLQWFPGYAVGSPQGDLLPPQKNWASLGAQAYSALVCLLFLNACRALSFSRPVPQPSICTLLTPQGLPGWPASTLPAVREVGSGRTRSQRCRSSSALESRLPGLSVCQAGLHPSSRVWAELSVAAINGEQPSLFWIAVRAREEFQAVREYSGFC